MPVLELFEIQTQEGPCLDSHRTHMPVVNHDLGDVANAVITGTLAASALDHRRPGPEVRRLEDRHLEDVPADSDTVNRLIETENDATTTTTSPRPPTVIPLRSRRRKPVAAGVRGRPTVVPVRFEFRPWEAVEQP